MRVKKDDGYYITKPTPNGRSGAADDPNTYAVNDAEAFNATDDVGKVAVPNNTLVWMAVNEYNKDNGAALYHFEYHSNTGLSGASGYSGFSGFSGYSGYSGTRGYSGYSGTGGNSGTSGCSGYSGATGGGYSGASGYSGATGQPFDTVAIAATGTLSSPPTVSVGAAWLDTTDSSQHPILRVRAY